MANLFIPYTTHFHLTHLRVQVIPLWDSVKSSVHRSEVMEQKSFHPIDESSPDRISKDYSRLVSQNQTRQLWLSVKSYV